jgi:formate hydrogenlyase subunit 6/NADH:ubiquinone oxidoreductase subunit I
MSSMPYYNRIIIDDTVKDLVKNNYYSQPLPDMDFTKCVYKAFLHELICPVNFLELSEKILKDLARDIEAKTRREFELEEEMRQQKERSKSPVAIAYAQALDDLGRILKEDLNGINKYIQKRTTDRELISNVDKMLSNVYKRYFLEKTKIFSEIE